VAAGLRVELIGNDVLATVVGVVWLVGITNAFNLLDNMDGLAATLAAVACGYFAIDAATLHEDPLVLALALSLGFACLGFLPYNLRPRSRAAVFMGDSGSQVLGFMLAALGLAASWTTAGTTVATMLLPLLVLAIPILDTTLVTLVRLVERRPVTQGGRDHSSHRLVYYGLSESRAVGLLAIIAIALGATGVAYNVLDEPRVTAIGVVLTFVLLVQFGGFLTELSERARRGQPGDTSLRHALTFEPRRLVEVLVDFVLISGSFLAAYLLVVGGKGSELQRGLFLAALPVVLGMRYVAFVGFRIYRRVWRYATARDALAIGAACVVSEIAAVAVIAATRSFGEFPARIFAVDAVVCTAAVTFSRLLLRIAPDLRGLRGRGDRRRVLVVGAGRAGRSLVREFREDPEARVVGFLDDNPALRRRRIQGVTVLGATDEIATVLVSSRPDEVLVSIPNAPGERLDSVVRACGEAEVPCRFVRRRTETQSPLLEVAAE
jgi:UDP-GlcNAc:undecaprenyl-phosphate/decaprenyl-phosphate GlcNAc-1-phosphate transferase